MKYEHRRQPIVPLRVFILRLGWAGLRAGGVVFVSLFIGVFGYHYFESMPWVDAILNASMILSGMGPATALQTESGKLFASGYALFSGIVFLSVAALILGPVVHRMLHHFHLDSR